MLSLLGPDRYSRIQLGQRNLLFGHPGVAPDGGSPMTQACIYNDAFHIEVKASVGTIEDKDQ